YVPGLGAAIPDRALASAQRALDDQGSAARRIVVVSDFQRSNGPWTAEGVDSSIAVEPIRVGGEYDNAFISSTFVRGSGEGAAAVVARVRVSGAIRDLALSEAPLRDGSGAPGVAISADGDAWRATALDPDAFDADDAHYFVGPVGGRVAVCDP